MGVVGILLTIFVNRFFFIIAVTDIILRSPLAVTCLILTYPVQFLSGLRGKPFRKVAKKCNEV